VLVDIAGQVGGSRGAGGPFDLGQLTVSMSHLLPLGALLRRCRHVMVPTSDLRGKTTRFFV